MNAFPNMTGQQGMDLRDYFAAKAIAGLIQGGTHPNVWELATEAYMIADAMMETRK
jgi:hypothetical protein